MEDGAKSASQLIHTSNCRSATCQVTDGFDSASWRNWTRWLAEINSLAGENEVAGGREWNSHLVVSQPLSNCWNRQFWKCLSTSQTAGSATAYPALLIGIYSMYMLYQYYIMQHTQRVWFTVVFPLASNMLVLRTIKCNPLYTVTWNKMNKAWSIPCTLL